MQRRPPDHTAGRRHRAITLAGISALPRGRSRVVPAALATLLLGLGLAACVPGTAPAENGRLPDTSLTTIAPTCRVANDVTPHLQALLAAAKADGVALVPETSSHIEPLIGPSVIESCYRSYDGQVWWRNFYCFFGQCGNAAVPGTSVHGWGRAVDFEDDHGELQATGDSPGYVWLVWNAATYGFVHPDWAKPGNPNAEAWHWEAR